MRYEGVTVGDGSGLLGDGHLRDPSSPCLAIIHLGKKKR